MSSYVVRRNGATGRVSQVRVMLRFQQSLGKTAIGLGESYGCDLARCVEAWNKAELDLNLNSTPPQYLNQSLGGCIYRWHRWWHKDLESNDLIVLPRPHCFLLNLIKPLQPMLAILRGVLQKKERGGGH